MLKLATVLLTLTLTACATPPQFVSNYFDSQDPCLTKPYPSWCGASLDNTYVYGKGGRTEVIIKSDSNTVFVNH